MTDANIDVGEILGSLTRLDVDIASMRFSAREARFLVDAYYMMQRDRIRAQHQNRTLEEFDESNEVMVWFKNQRMFLENQLLKALNVYASGSDIGMWSMSIVGIGPVFTAGLLANLDIEKAPTVGHWYRFAGLDPTYEWLGKEKAKKLVNDAIVHMQAHNEDVGTAKKVSPELIIRIAHELNTTPDNFRKRLIDFKKEGHPMREGREALIAAAAKRPWNGSLKRLCFLIGQSFTKVHNKEDDVYGKVYQARYEYEHRKNDRGEYSDLARKALNDKDFGEDTEARKHYEKGHLPPARILRRAQRYATKMYLSDLHCVWHWVHYNRLPPKPYVIDHLGHVDYYGVPNRHMIPGLAEALKGIMREGPYVG